MGEKRYKQGICKLEDLDILKKISPEKSFEITKEISEKMIKVKREYISKKARSQINYLLD